MTEQVTVEATYTPDDFFTGSTPVDTTEVTIKSGEDLAARTAVAVETATGKCVGYAKADVANYVGGIANYIIAYAADATGGDLVVQAYKAGTFNPDKVVVSGAANNLEKAAAFAGTPISLQTPQK
jgi:hypothetical protein